MCKNVYNIKEQRNELDSQRNSICICMEALERASHVSRASYFLTKNVEIMH